MQPWENDKNPDFGSNFGPSKFFSWVLSQLIDRQCSKLSPYAISKKTDKPSLKKWQKKQILGPNLAFKGFCLY